MEHVLTAKEMKYYDNYTIEKVQIPSLLLMERAAMEMSLCIEQRTKADSCVIVFAGTGNNGGDAFAIGRILSQKGMEVVFYMPGGKAKATPEMQTQMQIIENMGFSIHSILPKKEYDIVIDGLFGIGLSREVTGVYAKAIEEINELKEKGAMVAAVDIPSGICADTGKVMGCAVRADMTVAFEFAKAGHYFFPGREFAGELVVCGIGISHKALKEKEPSYITANRTDLFKLLPKRKPYGNKGTFGKVLLFAGNKEMCGAAVLCGKAVFTAGAGMLKIVTSKENGDVLRKILPEAMLYMYENKAEKERLIEAINWADVLVAGPGIGKTDDAAEVLQTFLEQKEKPFVIDADALNLIAENSSLQKLVMSYNKNHIIMTPHPGELIRLSKNSMDEYKEISNVIIRELAQKYGCVIVGKDAVTLVAESDRSILFLNHLGNDGMAVAGSGDVLAGIIGGLLAQNMQAFDAAKTGVLLHAIAGDEAAATRSRMGMMTSDILDGVCNVLKEAEEQRSL